MHAIQPTPPLYKQHQSSNFFTNHQYFVDQIKKKKKKYLVMARILNMLCIILAAVASIAGNCEAARGLKFIPWPWPHFAPAPAPAYPGFFPYLTPLPSIPILPYPIPPKAPAPAPPPSY